MVEGQPPAACHAVALGGQKHTDLGTLGGKNGAPQNRASTKQDRWSAKRKRERSIGPE
jgi:hypothetical protein